MSDSAIAPLSPRDRRKEARDRRKKALDISTERGLPALRSNGEEDAYIASHGFPVSSFSKGLPHDALGQVRMEDYAKLRKALSEGDPEDFEKIPLGTPGGRRLTNPQAGLGYDLEGPDPQSFAIPPVPRLDSRQNDAEMVELYWMSLLRDVPFTSFESNADVAAAAAELEGYRDVLNVPRISHVTPRTVFRGFTEGDLPGPYISQFLLHDIPYGALTISQRRKTMQAGLDYLTDFDTWRAIQNGVDPGSDDVLDPSGEFYIRDMRDLARYVHVDALYEAYLNAALILLDRKARVDGGNPYTDSKNQAGFCTFGDPEILSLVTEVATRALKAMWFQKWFVHRRLRPEEYGGRIDVHRRGLAHYPIHDALLSSQAHQRVLSRFHSSLLPQAFKEGSPLHPAYGSGHATVAGACVTILKAWFIGGDPLPVPAMVPSTDGTQLVPYTGADRAQLTIGGELDKLASNIATGRNMSGVHWRSDYREAVLLGEQVALGVLQERSVLYNEKNLFTVVTFDGRTLKIEDGEIRDTTGRSHVLSGGPVPPIAASAASTL